MSMKMQPSPILTPLLSVAIALLTLPAIAADADWAQWRGPHRDGHAAPQKLLQRWPAGGPNIKWECRDLGVGYSGISVRGDRLYTMGADESSSAVICIDAAQGKPLWRTPISRVGVEDDYAQGWGGGPRSTPTIDGEHVYALSDVGVLACLNAASGDLVWSVDFVERYGSAIPKWGFSESVLVDGDRVVATPGGENFMVAFDKQTGEQVWSSSDYDDGAQYVSIIKHSVGDVTFYVTASKTGLVAFDVDSGQRLFSDPATGNVTAVIPTPIVSENLLYHTSDYGAGNVLLKLTAEGGKLQAEQQYHLSAKSMQNHHGGVVLFEGVIYGSSKVSGGVWMAQDLETGDDLWMERMRPNRSGAIALADGRLYCYNDVDATLQLVEPSREAFKPVGELTLPETTDIDRGRGAIWAHPVIAGGTLYLRDQDLIFAYDIARD